MSQAPNPEIRKVKRDGSLGEILPDFRTLDYLDDTMDVGTVTFDYPERGGLRRELLDGQKEFALLLDGKEADNGRFLLDAFSGNKASDTPGYVTWSGKTLIARLDEAIVEPTNDEARLDVLTEEERDQFLAARDEWVRKQIDRIRKKHLLQPIRLHADDDGGKDRNSDIGGAYQAGGRDLLQKGTDDATGSGKRKDLLQPLELSDDASDIDWRDKLRPGFWRRRFDPPAGLAERMDTAPPPKPPTFKDVTPGMFVRTLFRAAQERGALANLRIDFNDKRDSAGRPWQTTMSLKPEIGSTLLTHLRWLAEKKKAEPRMKGRTLQLFNADYGNPERASVLFARGKNVVDGPQEGTTEELVTAVFCTSDTGVHGWVYDQRLVDRYGVIEGTFEAQAVQTWRELRKEGLEYLKENGRQKQQNTFGVVVEPGTIPYKDYRAGSWVLMALDGKEPEPQRIRAITMSWDEARNLSSGVTLNDRLYEAEITAQRALKSLTGKAGMASLRKQSQVIDFGPAVSDARPPNKPSAPAAGARNGNIEIATDWTDSDGYPAIWDQDHIQVHKSTESPEFEPDDSTLAGKLYTAGSMVLATEPYDVDQYIRLVAVDRGGDRSEPSDAAIVTARGISGGDFDPGGPELPAPLIPGVVGEPDPDNPDNPEGTLKWIGAYEVEKMLSGHMQTDVGVAGRFYVCQYADPNDPNSGPAENSAVIEMTPDGGFIVWIPVLNPDGTWQYMYSVPGDPTSPLVQRRIRSVHFPALAYERDDPDDPQSPWHQVIARMAGGEVETEDLTVSGPLKLNGPMTVGLDGSIRLSSTVTDPTKRASVTYEPAVRRWPGSENFTEVGMSYGSTSGLIVQARVTPDSKEEFSHIRARYIDPDTGFLDHDSNGSFPWYQIAGFVRTGGRNYVLGKWLNAGAPWVIAEMLDDMSGFTGLEKNVDSLMGGGYNYGCLGDANRDDCVAFAYRDNNNEIHIRYYTLGLNDHGTLTNRNSLGTNTSRSMVGVPEVDVVAAGNKVFWFDGSVYNDAKSWTTPTTMTGCCYLPGTGFISSHGDGSLSVYNDDITGHPDVFFTYTFIDGDGHETKMAPPLNDRWATRKFAIVEAATVPPGATDVRIYAGTGDTEAALFPIPKDPGVQANAASIPTTGANPPATSSFPPGTPSSLVTPDALIPGTSRPAAWIDSTGKAELYGYVNPEVSRARGTAQSIPHSSNTAVFWPIQREAHTDIVYVGPHFQVLNAGRYRILASVAYEANTSGRRQVGIDINSSGFPNAQNRVPAASGTACAPFVQRTIRLAAGDTITILAFQNSGGALDLQADDSLNFVEIERKGS